MNSVSFRPTGRGLRPAAARQRGVVLIMALIMLVVVSLLATMSIRSATSTEAVSGNIRTSGMAAQAAETALRYCEDTLSTVLGTPPAAAPASWNVVNRCPNANAACNALTGVTPAAWDTAGGATDAFVVPLSLVNTGVVVTFKRAPECMIEWVRSASTVAPFYKTTTYVITARGFGPEVPAIVGTNRVRPEGSEVWMQSTIEFN